MDFTNYKTVIFDFDGVIVDSNEIKKQAITTAAKAHSNSDYAENFVEYFICNNGIPREIKINKFYPNSLTSQSILADYNKALEQSISTMALTEGFADFIVALKRQANPQCYVLSGGTQSEVRRIIDYHKLGALFVEIYGGPLTKNENIQKIPLNEKTLFIGDSIVDYEVAVQNNIDFAFMYGYSQFNQWRDFFTDKKVVTFKNFKNPT